MFDIGFSEIVLLLVVGLLVLGPERLPRVARTIGAYLGRARRAFDQVRREINQELQADDFRKTWQESVLAAKKTITEAGQEAQRAATIEPFASKTPATPSKPGPSEPAPLAGGPPDQHRHAAPDPASPLKSNDN